MTDRTQTQFKSNVFWDFSIAFYRQEGAEAALLLLQKTFGFNVNVVLFCFWYAMAGQGGLSQKRVRHILTLVAPWHNKVVLPLRRLRDTLKAQAQEAEDDALRKSILLEELRAEQVEQMMIYDDLWIDTPRIKSPAQKVADICRSLASYCYLLRVKADDELVCAVNELLGLLLPQLDAQAIAEISSERLHNHPKMSKVVGTQLWLDL